MLLPDSAEMRMTDQPHLSSEALLSLISLLIPLLDTEAATVAFVLGHETDVCKTDFRFALFFRDMKNSVRAIPLAFVFDKAKVAV